jgi:hypothetical protein
VYIEGLTSADYLVRQHIPAYTLAFDRLRVASLGDRESLAIINHDHCVWTPTSP